MSEPPSAAQWIIGNQNVQIRDAGAGSQISVTINNEPRRRVPLEPVGAPIAAGESRPSRLLTARAGIVPWSWAARRYFRRDGGMGELCRSVCGPHS